MNLKRLAALLLAAVMAVTMLAGCGQVEDEPLPRPSGSIDPSVTEPPITTPEPTTTLPETTPAPETTPEPVTTPAPETTVTTAETKPETKSETSSKDDYTVEPMSATMYATMSLNVRKGPSTDFGKLGALAEGDEVNVTGRASTGWYEIDFKGGKGFVSNLYISADKPAAAAVTTKKEDNETENVDEGRTETENVSEGSKTPATTASTGTSDTTPSTTATAIGGDWVKANECEYMYGLFKEDRFKSALNKIALAVEQLLPVVNIGEYVSDDEAGEIASKIAHIVGTGYCYFEGVGSRRGSTLYLDYYVDNLDAAKKMMNDLSSKADSILAGCSGMSDYNKVKYIYEYLCQHVRYGGSYEGSTYGPIVDGGATCLGYAKGTFYLLSRAGFDVVYDVGVGMEAMHAWVKVKINGNWYNIDTTWGDPDGDVFEQDLSYLNYDFLCVTDQYMKNTRSTVYDLSKYYTMPSATSNDLNWYKLNGYYADTYDEGVAILKKQLESAAADTKTAYRYLRVQFSNEEEFMKFSNHFTLKTFQSEIVKPYTSKRVTNQKFSDTNNELKRTLSVTFRMRQG